MQVIAHSDHPKHLDV